jgi:hypothetical protein
VATETDAARDRVLEARASLAEELEVLEASVRAAVDIPAKIKRSPVKAAAIAGGAGFLVLGGPKRLYRAGRRAVTGEPEPLPPSMLPEEIDKALKAMGDDGRKVRGALERDFTAYAKKREKDRSGLRTLLLLSVARPLLSAAAKTAATRLLSTDDVGFQERLAIIRERAKRQSDHDDEAKADGDGSTGGTVMERAAETDAAKDRDKGRAKDKGA